MFHSEFSNNGGCPWWTLFEFLDNYFFPPTILDTAVQLKCEDCSWYSAKIANMFMHVSARLSQTTLHLFQYTSHIHQLCFYSHRWHTEY